MQEEQRDPNMKILFISDAPKLREVKIPLAQFEKTEGSDRAECAQLVLCVPYEAMRTLAAAFIVQDEDPANHDTYWFVMKSKIPFAGIIHLEEFTAEECAEHYEDPMKLFKALEKTVLQEITK